MPLNDHRNQDGTYDGPGALGELTGLGRPAMMEIWDGVKANHSLLQSCCGHDFAPAVGPAARKRKCNNCGGDAGIIEVKWYEDGRRHGARNG